MEKALTKNCAICDKQYVTYNPRSTCCSRKCSAEWRRQTYKGRKLTPEHVANQNASKTRDKIIRYGDYACQKCNKKFETNVSLRSHTAYCNADNEPRDVACSECGRVFNYKRSLTMHLKFHDVAYVEEHSSKVKIAIADRAPQKRNSKPELEFLVKLQELYGKEVVHKHRIEGINHEFDFYVPSLNLVIEFDGDYWHGNKEMFELTPKMKKQYCIDRDYTLAAKTKGFEVHRVWDSQAVNYPSILRIID
jgi:very-short-patch-repair endonuclease